MPGVQSSEKSQTSLRMTLWSVQAASVTSPDGKPPVWVITWCSVMSALPRAANSGRWSATLSMKDSLPSSISVQTVALVNTFVWENIWNRVRSFTACAPGVRAGLAVAAEQQQLAVPRQRDLRTGIAARRDVLLDQRLEVIELLCRDAVLCEVACGQRVGFDFYGRIHGVPLDFLL